jgi:ribA/ribD-fused uncharacterized protein
MVYMSKEQDAILFYEGEYYMFSNFAAFAVSYNGRIWMTSEHAYQAAKFDDENVINSIHTALSAHDSKKVAHTYKNQIRANWDETKVAVMEDIVRAKIAQHPYIREKLLSTGSREILEDSHKDSFWGRGADFKGRNELGKVWMKIREEIRNK